MWFILLSIALLYLFFILLDSFAPARSQPVSPFWRLRGFFGMVLYFGIAFTSPVLWESLLAEHTLLNATDYALWIQVLGGFVALELGIYTWHRILHANNFLWQHSHRLHHSAERFDIWGAFWFHPIDSIAWTFVGSLALVGIVGVSAPAAIIINLMGTFLAMFQHANLKTPYWLGYFIVRPENHNLHHERGIHRRNYCDLPLIDMLFGTFENAKSAPQEVGFFLGASSQHTALLLGLELHQKEEDHPSC